MLVVNRFRIADSEAEDFRSALEHVHGLLRDKPGYVAGHIGRNADDPDLWAFVTEWDGPGAYRRAIGAHDIRVVVWEVIGRAIDEPSAYEVVRPGQPVNDHRARG